MQFQSMVLFSARKGGTLELELWSELSQAVCAVAGRAEFNPRDTCPTALIARVYLGSVLHDRPVIWGCDPRHWTAQTRPERLPSQCTPSRRIRRPDFQAFLNLMGQHLNGRAKSNLLKVVDGKPLELPNHSSDPDVRWGRGVSRQSPGDKLQVIDSGNPMPDAFVITPLDGCEKQMCGRMLKRLKGTGYLLANAHDDCSWLFDLCHHHRRRLVCPRPKPGAGLGHRYQSPLRVR